MKYMEEGQRERGRERRENRTTVVGGYRGRDRYLGWGGRGGRLGGEVSNYKHKRVGGKIIIYTWRPLRW